MPPDNKTRQSSLFSGIFSAADIHYDDYLLPPNDFIREKHFARLNPRPGDRVLEIGTGISSFLARTVRRHRVEAYGLDYVQTSLLAQKRNSPTELRLCRGDGERLPYRDDSFDIVVAISVLEHLSDYDQGFSEIRRVLRPAGVCLLQVPCRDFRYSLFARLKSVDDLRDKEWFLKNQAVSGHDFNRIPDRTGWKRLAENNRLSIISALSADVILDSWMMYYFFQRIKKIQSEYIRRARSGPGRDTVEPNVSASESPVANKLDLAGRGGQRRYSAKRRALGLLWIHVVLRAFWFLQAPERALSRLPIGAGLYLCARKNP